MLQANQPQQRSRLLHLQQPKPIYRAPNQKLTAACLTQRPRFTLSTTRRETLHSTLSELFSSFQCCSGQLEESADCGCSYGHVAQLAKKEKEGVDSVPGCEGILYQVSLLHFMGSQLLSFLQGCNQSHGLISGEGDPAG